MKLKHWPATVHPDRLLKIQAEIRVAEGAGAEKRVFFECESHGPYPSVHGVEKICSAANATDPEVCGITQIMSLYCGRKAQRHED